MSISVETFFLDPATEGTLQARIQQMVAQGILAGRFRAGERLPSSRKMALHLGVSRITVTLAYTELVADDYLTSRGRSGYFVSENAPEPPAFPASNPAQAPLTGPVRLANDLRRPWAWTSQPIGQNINIRSFMDKPIPRCLTQQTGGFAHFRPLVGAIFPR